MNRLLKLFFEKRGYDSSFLEKINSCPHGNPAGTDQLCAFLKECHDNGRHITLLTDFDMDGIMSGVIGYAGLSELGFGVSLFLPDVSGGYGFDGDDIVRLHAENPDTYAVLTADVGITAYAGIEKAKEFGMKVFVTDHHSPEGANPADIVVDPERPEDEEGYDGCCGAHVLYSVLYRYAQLYQNDPFTMEQISRLRVFAGIGTVSDSMPMLYENRDVVRDAVSIFRFLYNDGDPSAALAIPGCPVYRKAFWGLYTIAACFAANRKLSSSDAVTEQFFGFYLAPVFNSVKRMNGDVADAFGVFFDSRPQDHMKTLFALNEERKAAVQMFLEQIKIEVEEGKQPQAPYIYMTKAGGGLRGLLANLLMQESGEPVLVFGEDGGNYYGSGRSPAWFPFLSTMGLSEHFRCNGHENAFGITAFSEIGLDEVFERMETLIPKLRPENIEELSQPDIILSTYGDGDAQPDVPLLDDFVSELARFAPYGPDFPAPDILLKFDASDVIIQTMGSEKQHLKMYLPNGLVVICWKYGYLAPVLSDWKGAVFVSGAVGVSDYGGNHTVQFTGDILLSSFPDGLLGKEGLSA